MATFFDTVQNTVRIDFAALSANQVLYTVPAGRRAKIRVIHIVASSNVTLQMGGYDVINGLGAQLDYPDATLSDVSRFWDKEHWLNAGDTIEKIAGSSLTFQAVVEEYANP